MSLVSNPRRNVWNSARSIPRHAAGVFQIPEGTFGTHNVRSGAAPSHGVSNPRRNVWNAAQCHGDVDVDSVSNPRRNVWNVAAGPTEMHRRRFKSQKERLERVRAQALRDAMAVFQIPEGTFGTGLHKSRVRRLLGFQIPEGTFGTGVWDVVCDIYAPFQIPEGTFGTPGKADVRASASRFQIPEGTFGTCVGEVLKAVDPGFKSQKERLEL